MKNAAKTEFGNENATTCGCQVGAILPLVANYSRLEAIGGLGAECPPEDHLSENRALLSDLLYD